MAAADLIIIDPEEDPVAVLQALPEEEVTCMEDAFGSERLLEVVGGEELSPEDEAEIQACLSEETAKRIMLGMIMGEGVSDEAISCMDVQTQDVDFLAMVTEASEQEGFGGDTIPVFRAITNCLSEEEFARSGMFGGEGGEGGPGLEQFRCLFENADDETIFMLFQSGEGGGGELPSGELIDLMIQCDFDAGLGPGDGGGPPQLTQEQQACVIDAIGETAFNELISGQRQPTLEQLQSIEACGIPLGPGPGPREEEWGAGQEPGPSAEQLACMTQAIGQQALTEITTGQREPTAEEVQGLMACGAPAPRPVEEPLPPETSAPVPITPEQEACIIDAIGETAFNELISRQREPTAEEVQSLMACGAPAPRPPEEPVPPETPGPVPIEEPVPPETPAPVPLTPAQASCIINAIGQTAFNEVTSGQRPPTSGEDQSIRACTS